MNLLLRYGFKYISGTHQIYLLKSGKIKPCLWSTWVNATKKNNVTTATNLNRQLTFKDMKWHANDGNKLYDPTLSNARYAVETLLKQFRLTSKKSSWY